MTAGVGEAVGRDPATVGVGVSIGIGMLIGVADGASEGAAAPAATLVARGSGEIATVLGLVTGETDGAGDRTPPVATVLGDGSDARAAAEGLVEAARLDCVQAVSARSAGSAIDEKSRGQFHIRRTVLIEHDDRPSGTAVNLTVV